MPTTRDQLAQIQSVLASDLAQLAPELILVGGILLLLLSRLVPKCERVHLGPLAMAAVILAGVTLTLVPLAVNGDSEPTSSTAGFGQLLIFDQLAQYVRGVVLAATLVVLAICQITKLPDGEDSVDFAVMLLGSALGLMLMASANHLLMLFIAIEMAGLPGYALAGFRKGDRQGSEAALKYVVFGAASAGVMLYGISLITSSYGSGQFSTVLEGFAQNIADDGYPAAATAGWVMLLIGLGFKLAAVPFHFWLPDAFAGATAEVGAFLSVASKAATVGVLCRLLLGLQESAVAAGVEPSLLPKTLGAGLAVVAALTVSLGNLAALPQTNLKRLLAYSTIAHAGYMLMALAPLSRTGFEAALFYLPVYLLMNLGAFGVVAFVRNATKQETIDACRGLLVRSPALGITLAIFLMSLLGLPPLAGFAVKFQVFSSVYQAGPIHPVFYLLLAVGIINTVISAGYYLAILRSAGLDSPIDLTDEGEVKPLNEPWSAAILLSLLAVGLFLFGVRWDWLTNLASAALPN